MKLWDIDGNQKLTSTFDKNINELEKCDYSELLKKTEKLVSYARSKKKK